MQQDCSTKGHYVQIRRQCLYALKEDEMEVPYLRLGVAFVWQVF